MTTIDPRQVDHDTAERVAQRRLDRRRRYAVINDAVCQLATWTDLCSGCNGDGCRECGYQGRRRTGQWFPLADSRDAGTPGGGA